MLKTYGDVIKKLFNTIDPSLTVYKCKKQRPVSTQGPRVLINVDHHAVTTPLRSATASAN